MTESRRLITHYKDHMGREHVAAGVASVAEEDGNCVLLTEEKIQETELSLHSKTQNGRGEQVAQATGLEREPDTETNSKSHWIGL